MNKSFVRKIVYLVILGMLLVPISMVSRPSTLNSGSGSSSRGNSGGELANLRVMHVLAQEQISEIDPASETMKLASLGLRGLASLLLWNQANEQKKTHNFEGLEATLNLLVKIQPNFVKVWDFQAHNLSYNISVEFDDYEYRYHWVKKGIRFLTKGIAFNKRDHRITDDLGWFTGMKIGYSDEKTEFRRLFRKDRDYHEEMAEFIEPDSYYLREYEYDNWKMAYQWYTISRNKVLVEGNRKYSGDLLFFMKRPAQIRNMAEAIQTENRANESIQNFWTDASREWMEFGKQPLTVGPGAPITMESFTELDERLEYLRGQLDSYAPGVRVSFRNELLQSLNISAQDREILDRPVDQRSDDERIGIREIENRLTSSQIALDQMVLEQISVDNRAVAQRIFDQIQNTISDMATLESNNSVANYRYWKVYCQVESERAAVVAHQELFDASELQRKSIFDDEYTLDPKTKQPVITQLGAISTYEKSFVLWNEILNDKPILHLGHLADNITDVMKKYYDMLEMTDKKWPRHHPLQYLVDAGSNLNKLPFADEVAEMYGEEVAPKPIPNDAPPAVPGQNRNQKDDEEE